MAEEPMLSVVIYGETDVTEFKAWVAATGRHLQGPVVLSDGDSETWFLRPFPTEEDFQRAITAALAHGLHIPLPPEATPPPAQP
jgi:hypothetical protein